MLCAEPEAEHREKLADPQSEQADQQTDFLGRLLRVNVAADFQHGTACSLPEMRVTCEVYARTL